MNKIKAIVIVITIAIFFINGTVVSFIHKPAVHFGMSRAEAGFDWGKLLDVGTEVLIEKTTSDLLKHLSKASVQMTYAKIKMAEAVGMEPEKIQGARQAMLAIVRTPNNLNAISAVNQLSISDADIESHLVAAMDTTDQERMMQVTALMQEAKLARHAAHKNNLAAAAKAVALIALLQKRAHDHPEEKETRIKNFLAIGLISQQLIEEQKKSSKKLNLITKDFDTRWKVKDPSSKEIKKFEKKLDKELKPV